MSKTYRQSGMDRRTFLKVGSLGAAAAAWPGSVFGEAEKPAEPQFRVLGRTGLKISVVSMGAMRTSESAIMQAAFDRGVNYIDTARCYMDGKNEKIVGEALKGRRDKVYLASKCHMVAPKEDIIKSVEDSLSALQTDYIDVLQLHHPATTEVLHADAKAALTQLREQGKIRFVGVTAHSDEAAMLDTLVQDPDKFFDTILVTYNFKSPEAVTQAIERAAKAGIGVIAMKTQAGGYETKELGDVSPHQAALKWVLKNPNVAAAIPAMVNLDEVKEDTAVLQMDLKLAREECETLRRYDVATASYYCYRCGACSSTCPARVDIATINRSLMYAEGYRDLELARETHASIPPDRSSAACGDCAQCVAQCIHKVDIPRQVRRARELFA